MPAADDQPEPRKPLRFFRTFAAMRDVLLAHGARLTPAERLAELNRLNRIAYREAYALPVGNRKTRFQLYTQRPDESLTEFFARAQADRQQWLATRGLAGPTAGD